MSDNVVRSPIPPSVKTPSEPTPDVQPPAPAPAPAKAKAPARAKADAGAAFQPTDPKLKQAQDKIQPPAMQTVVPESRAGRKTKEDLKANLLMGQLSPRPAPKRKTKSGMPKVQTKKWDRDLDQLEKLLTEKSAIVDQKRRVDEKPVAAQEHDYQSIADGFYKPFAPQVSCKFVQKAHLPTDNQGVCAAMTMHWAERTVRGGDPRFSYRSEVGADGKGLHQKFEDLVASQKIAHSNVQQAALREGLQAVGSGSGDRNQVRQSGQLLIDNAANAATLEGARAARQTAMEKKADIQSRFKQVDELTEKYRTELAQAKQSGTQEAIAQATGNLERVQKIGANGRAKLVELDHEIAAQQQKIDQTSEAVRDAWLAQIDTLKPGKTYAVVFTHGHSGHAVGIRTAPPVPDPLPVPPPDPRPTPYIDVMDPNIGEFHFDNGNPGQIEACGEFLKKWGDEYLGKRGYDGAYFYEIQAG